MRPCGPIDTRETVLPSDCPRQESNLDFELRTLAWSPFHHGDERERRMMNSECRMRRRDHRFLFAFRLPFCIHHSAFRISLPLPPPGLEPGTRRSKRRVIVRFTTGAYVQCAPRAPPAGAGISAGVRNDTPDMRTKKPRSLPGSGVRRHAKSTHPGHPVMARRSSLRSARRSRRDSSTHDERAAQAPRRKRRSVRESGANCPDKVVMGSTIKRSRRSESYNMYRAQAGSQLLNRDAPTKRSKT